MLREVSPNAITKILFQSIKPFLRLIRTNIHGDKIFKKCSIIWMPPINIINVFHVERIKLLKVKSYNFILCMH